MARITPKLRTLLENSPYPRRLGFRLLDLQDGYARVAVTTGPEHANFLGSTDGGVLASLADYAGACATNTLGRTMWGIQLSMNFVGSAPLNSEFFGEAKVVHAGRTIALVDISVTNKSGKLIARGTGTGFAKAA